MPRRVLIVHTGGGLGDVLLSTPIAEAVARSEPGVVVDYWVAPAHAPILSGHPHIAHVWTVDPRGPFFDVLAWLRRQMYDVALLPWATDRLAWLVALAEIDRRVGPGNRLAYSYLFTDRVVDHQAHGDTSTHVVSLQLEWAQALGCETLGLGPRLRVSEGEAAEASALLRSEGARPGDRLCLLHVARGMDLSNRPWPTDRFVEAARRLQAELALRIVLIGTPREQAVANHVRDRLGPDVVNLAGRTNLRLACAVIARCALVVTLDTGPMHLAAALGVPVVAVFPMTCYPVDRWRPFAAPHRIVQTGAWRCGRHCVKETCPDFACHDAVDPDEIVRSASELLTERHAGPTVVGHSPGNGLAS